MPVDHVKFQWIMRASELSTLRKALRLGRTHAPHDSCPFDQSLDDLDDYAHAAFEPLSLVSGMVAIDCLVDRIQDHIYGSRQKGLRIDIQGQNLAIREDHAVQHGTVLVAHPHGTLRLSSPTAIAIVAAIRVPASGRNRN